MAFNLDEHTGVLIKKAARLFERVANLNLDDLGITYAQTIFLVRLWDKDGQNQMELTKSAGLKQPTVVRILDRMERDKLVKRVRNKNDRRIYNFYLTEKAKVACRKLEKQGTMMQELATGTLHIKKVDELNKYLLEIISNLEDFMETNKV